MRRAAKIDANQTAIVKALRGHGCSVVSLASVGKGIPDLMVGRANRTYLLECKRNDVPPSQRKLTPDEAEFFGSWAGHAAVVHSVEEAIVAVGIKKK